MKHVNLIPPARRAKLDERRRRNAWMRVLRGYAILLAAGCASAYFPANAAAPLIEASLERVDRRIEKARGELDKVKAETSTLQSRIDAAKAVGEHPDWSVLMDALTRARRGQVVLDSFDLVVARVDEKGKPVGTPAATPATSTSAPTASKGKPRDSVTLKVTGFCVAPGAAFDYARRLQALGFFDRVDVKDTRAQKLGEAVATHFDIEMQLVSGPTGPAPSTTTGAPTP